MEPEVRFAKIEAILHEMAERGNAVDRRMDRADARMDRADARMDRAEKRLDRAEKRMEWADNRMEKYDQRFDATRKLVEAGIKLLMGLGRRQADLAKSQKLFLDSLRRGNGKWPQASLTGLWRQMTPHKRQDLPHDLA